MVKKLCNASNSSNDSEALDVQPFRTLAPMFPASFGMNAKFPQPGATPVVCVTPFGSFASETEYPPEFCPIFPSAGPQSTPSKPAAPTPPSAGNGFAYESGGSFMNGSVYDVTPLSSFQTPPVAVKPLNEVNPFSSSSKPGKKRQKSSDQTGSLDLDSSSKKKKSKPIKPKRVPGGELLLLASSHDPVESVEVVMMTFDALRRRIMQLEEGKKNRSNLKGGSIMIANDLRANKEKRIGNVPGVEVGDIFYFRLEMCLIGLHSQTMSGIDYTTVKFGDGDDTVAIGIVSSGVYDNVDDDVNSLVYIGQGNSDKDDQKLERGNLALERSLHRANVIRVIRAVKDPTIVNGKIYIYDGLYKIHESWAEKAKSGFNIFKYKLLREPDQPDGIAVWKNTDKWKQNQSSRDNLVLLDLSSGVENVPVCVVNEVDDEKGPSHFTYTTSITSSRPPPAKLSSQGCVCASVCLPGDLNCSCLLQCGGYFPYSATGTLVSHKPIIYECSSLCRCSSDCRNRLTQKGVQYHFEVFKTRGRGWGLRCWDPIRAGSFICEYTGEVIENKDWVGDNEENDYIFQSASAADRNVNWNYIPELLEEPSPIESTEPPKPLPVTISSKRMGNISRFMNHSCSPNVFWQPVMHGHGNDGYPHINFFAIRHIPPMMELTFDYGTRAGAPRTKICLCGSAKCKGFFG